MHVIIIWMIYLWRVTTYVVNLTLDQIDGRFI